MRTNTIAGLLATARHKLPGETAALDARLLMQAATGFTHTEVVAEPDAVLTATQMTTFEAYILRRYNHEPVSRILGGREFYGRQFKVTPDVLDPRPDTECVVELALSQVKCGRFIDLGTGSGAIAITLCSENKDLSGVATDISASALTVARENAQALATLDRLDFRCSTWFAGIEDRFDLIVSNPPYIREDAELPPDVKNFDPHLALFGGADGLDAYRAIAVQSASYLTLSGALVVEVGHEQAPEVVEIFVRNNFKLTAETIDISGYTRGLAFQVRT